MSKQLAMYRAVERFEQAVLLRTRQCIENPVIDAEYRASLKALRNILRALFTACNEAAGSAAPTTAGWVNGAHIVSENCVRMLRDAVTLAKDGDE